MFHYLCAAKRFSQFGEILNYLASNEIEYYHIKPRIDSEKSIILRVFRVVNKYLDLKKSKKNQLKFK